MAYQEPAPRYALPKPASICPPVTTPEPRHRRRIAEIAAYAELRGALAAFGQAASDGLLLERMIDGLAKALEREREDYMFRAGLGFGFALGIGITAAAWAFI